MTEELKKIVSENALLRGRLGDAEDRFKEAQDKLEKSEYARYQK